MNERRQYSVLLRYVCEQNKVIAGYLSVCSGDSGPEEESSLCPEGRWYIWHNILLHLGAREIETMVLLAAQPSVLFSCTQVQSCTHYGCSAHRLVLLRPAYIVRR